MRTHHLHTTARLPLGVFLFAILAALLAAPSASAELQFGEGILARPGGPAVSQAQGGDVYVPDEAGERQRVNEFEPDGTFLRAFGWGLVPGAATGSGNLTLGSASVLGATTASGRFLAGQPISGPGIPSGTLVREVTSTELLLSKPAEETRTSTLTATAGPGNIPTNEVQQLTVSATSGQFILYFRSVSPGTTIEATAPIAYNAPANKGEGAGSVEAALEALPNIGPGNVAVSGGRGDATGTHPYRIEFKGRYADVDVVHLFPRSVSLAGGSPASEAALQTIAEGAGVPEICTTVCGEASSGEVGEQATGSEPGQFFNPTAVAVDNSCAQHEPPLTASTTPTCEEFDPSYGDLYVVDSSNYRVQKYDPEGHFLLMFGGGVDKGPHHPGDLCTAQYLAEGDTCGAGLPGTGSAHFHSGWEQGGNNSIAVGPDGTVYVGDHGRVQEFTPDGAFAGEFAPPGETTVKATGNLTKESTLVSSVAVTTGSFAVGQPITGPGIPPATNVTAVGSGTISISKPATETLTADPLSVEPQFVGSLGLDAHGDLFELSRNIAGVREFSPAPRALLTTFDATPGAEPGYLALDSEGDLFLSDYGQADLPQTRCNEVGQNQAECPYATFRAFKPDGALYAEFASETVHVPGNHPRFTQPTGIAFAAGTLYASALAIGSYAHVGAVSIPQPGPPEVKQEQVSDTEPETSTLHAIVNPKGYDTRYQFQYITQRHYEQDGNSFGAGTVKAPEPPADLGIVIRDDAVQAAISGLAPETTYRFRVVAESECEPVAQPGHICVVSPESSFESLPPVSVRNLATQRVAPEEVSIEAEADNNNSLTAGHWQICLGTQAGADPGGYSLGCREGQLKSGSSSFEAIEATFTGLAPNNAYHYRLFAENEYTPLLGHPTESADQTLATEETIAEQNAAANCPNALLREEDGSTALPDCRAYEQVSPPYKAGFPVKAEAPSLAPGGERVAFKSSGAFAGETNVVTNTYLARRTEAGWVTRGVNQPPAEAEFGAGETQQLDAGLTRWLDYSNNARTRGEGNAATARAYYLGSDSSFLKATPSLAALPGMGEVGFDVTGASADLSHLFLWASGPLMEGDPRPNNISAALSEDRIYEVSGAGGAAPQLSLVAELLPGLPQDTVEATYDCKIDRHMEMSQNRVSADGSLLFYVAPLEITAGGACESDVFLNRPNKAALFACHVAAGSCVEGQPGYHPASELSAPRLGTQCHSPSPCASSAPRSATFWGASPGGSLAWFTTEQPLIDADTDSSNDLYLARLEPNGEVAQLIQASAGDPAHGAGVLKVLKVSADGKVAAFLATGVLTSEANGAGETASQGAYNLYLYDSETEHLSFVARLCSGLGRSGSAADPACPAHPDKPTGGGTTEADPLAITPPGVSGRYFVFPTYARLSAGDTDTAEDIYRFDSQTGQLNRVSIGRRGNDANGNDPRYDAAPPSALSGLGKAETAQNVGAEDLSRYVSADGSLVLFETAAPLVSADTNAGSNPGCGSVNETGCDLYQWQQAGHGTCPASEAAGCVSLLSAGTAPHGFSRNSARIGESGTDVTFLTSDSLVPADTDGLLDVYDARTDGGFPLPELPPPCRVGGSPETCHGEATKPGPEPNPVTETNKHGPEPIEKPCKRGYVRKHGRCVKVRKHHHRKKRHRAALLNRGAHK